MMTAIILTYLTLVIALYYWALTNIAFTKRIKNKGLWRSIILLFPTLGPILYFQNKDKRAFNPKFGQR
jgi:uncharacterized membrane protein YwzB